MTVVYKLLDDGSFVAGDTGRTANCPAGNWGTVAGSPDYLTATAYAILRIGDAFLATSHKKDKANWSILSPPK
jgi:hypothetical protein